MKTKIYLLSIAVLFFSLKLSVNSWSQNELVNGYYAPDNDWFVFEWDNPDYGRMKTIYDPANKIKPVIKAEVVFDGEKQEYTYNYEVANQQDSIQSIDDIFIKYLAPVCNAKSPSPEEDWYSEEYERKSAWQWAKTGGDPSGIITGQTVSGFLFKSKGLPTIVNSGFTGERRTEFSGPGDSDAQEVHESFDRIFTQLKEQYKEKFVNYIMKKPLGPIAPPVDFKPVSFIDYIITMKHEAFSLGWITNQGIEQSLDAKLDNAKMEIAQGNTNTAKNILAAFINEVEAQKDKYLTSEGYGLLIYNVEYLIGRL